MKIQNNQLMASELIKHLQKAIEDNGDLPVRYTSESESDPEFGDSHPVVGFVTMMTDDDKPNYLMIGNDSFIDSMN